MILEAAIKVESRNGASSRETSEQRQSVMEFYASHNDVERASLSLDRVLECKMKPTGISSIDIFHADPGFNMWPEYRWSESVLPANPQLSIKILSKVLAAQQRQLPPDDQQLVET